MTFNYDKIAVGRFGLTGAALRFELGGVIDAIELRRPPFDDLDYMSMIQHFSPLLVQHSDAERRVLENVILRVQKSTVLEYEFVADGDRELYGRVSQDNGKLISSQKASTPRPIPLVAGRARFWNGREELSSRRILCLPRNSYPCIFRNL